MMEEQCEFCKEYLWGEEQTSCSGGLCSSAHEILMEKQNNLENEMED